MEEETLTNQIRGFIAEQLGLDFEEIGIETHFSADLGLDYIEIIELTMLIEEQFARATVVNDDDQIEFVKDLILHIQNSNPKPTMPLRS